MTEFHETGFGHKFYGIHVPDIVKSLKVIALALTEANALKREELDNQKCAERNIMDEYFEEQGFKKGSDITFLEYVANRIQSGEKSGREFNTPWTLETEFISAGSGITARIAEQVRDGKLEGINPTWKLVVRRII